MSYKVQADDILGKPLPPLFPFDVAGEIATYFRLTQNTPTAAEVKNTQAVVDTDGEVLLAAYVTPVLGAGLIEAGDWIFTTWGEVDSATGTSEIIIRVYKRVAAGTETELFNTTTGEINATSATAYGTVVSESVFDIAETDRMVVKYYAKTTHTSTVNISMYTGGTTHISKVMPPGGQGNGDMAGPATNADHAVARFDGVNSKTIQGSLATIDDAGSVNIPAGQAYNINGNPHSHLITYSTQSVSNPPTDAQIVAAFGNAYDVGAGFVGIINDSGEGINFYMCTSDGDNWWFSPLTKAVAAALVLLTILAADTYTDTNDVALDAHTMDTGAGWTENAGTWTIQGNKAAQGDASGQYVATVDVGKADYRASVIAKSTASGEYSMGMAVRFTDVSNFWKIQVLGEPTPLVRIVERNGGSETARASVSWPRQDTKNIQIDVECDGDDITVWVDGGYSLTYNSSFNNSATKVGVFEQRGAPYVAANFDNFQVVDLPAYPITRVGTVISETGTDEESNAQEPVVIYDGIFKMWYVHGFATPVINYAESVDGETWTKYGGNPILTGHYHPFVTKIDDVYYLYSANTAGTQIDLLTSSNGIDWTEDTSNVIPLGGSGAWDDTGLGNIFVWREGSSSWYAIYEAHTAWGTSDTWKLGLATSSDGKSWTKSGSNPVVSLSGSAGGPDVKKVGTYYYMWFHTTSTSTLPTRIVRYRSSNLTTWTPWPQFVQIPRVGNDEGENSYIGQVADIEIVTHGSTVYFYFTATSDGEHATGHMHIILATAPVGVGGGY